MHNIASVTDNCVALPVKTFPKKKKRVGCSQKFSTYYKEFMDRICCSLYGARMF